MKSTSDPLDYVVLRSFNWDSQFQGTEIGYIIDEDHWGQGLATRAVPEVARFAFEDAGLTELLALVNDKNTASIKIVQRLGFRRSLIKPEKLDSNSVWVKSTETTED